MGWLSFQKVPVWQNWTEPEDKVSYFPLSKKVKEYFRVFFSFVFLHNGIKAFEFRASREHVWLWPFAILNTAPKGKGEGSEGCSLRQVTPNPRAGCSEFSRLMWDTPGHEAVPFRAGTSRWKGPWRGGAAHGLGLFPCAALQGEAELGSWLFLLSCLAASDMLDDGTRLRSWSCSTCLRDENEVGTTGWASRSHGRDPLKNKC